jgi:hypothetical protein
MGKRIRVMVGVGAVALVLVAILLTTGAALAQRSALFSLGCWAITSSGGGDQRISASFRINDAITSIGGEMVGTSNRIRANHFAVWSALNPYPGPGTPPPADSQLLYLPLIFGRFLNLDQLCS